MQSHEMDFLKASLNILISAFCVCADSFEGLSKAFYLVQLSTFDLLFKNKLFTIINSENAY